MVPFGPYKDFSACISDQKSKGKSNESADKICGSLQSKLGGKTLQAQIDYNDCVDQAQQYGHDEETAQKICDAITGENDDEEEPQDNPTEESQEGDALKGNDNPSWYKSGADKKKKKPEDDTEEETMMNPDMNAASKMIENCVKAKQKKDDSLSDDDAMKECQDAFKGGNLQQQNQFTDPGKLDDYLDTEAIDWHSDAEADYNEKSDTKEIDLSYYDDDINKCVEDQVKNGLSQENARSFCNNLANYNGDGGIEEKDELQPVKYENREYVEGSDTGSHTAAIVDDSEPASVDDNTSDGDFIEEMEGFLEDVEKDLGLDDDQTKQAYYPTAETVEHDPLEDSPEIGSPVTGHGPNSIDDNFHTHDLSNDGPAYDQFGDNRVDEANNMQPDTYTGQNDSNLDNNDHIRKHMHPAQKTVGRGLIGTGYANAPLPPGEDEPASQEEPDEVTANAESPSWAPQGAQLLKKGESLAVKSVGISWIKNGKTYSAQMCEADHGNDEDAKSVCEYVAKHYSGNYDRYIADMQIQPFESNNKLFVKAFLMDSSVNLNQWGVTPQTLDANIRTYIGKPLVLQQNFDHPVSADDNLQHQLEYQELFRIGNIVDVVRKGSRYDAIAEITDDYAQQAFKEGNLPLYVSPQLYKLDANEPDKQMTRWTGTHLAVVKDPAYGIKLATINGECTGEHDKCMTYLKKAAIIHEHGYGSCGFCNYKLLSSVRQAQVTTTNNTSAIDVGNTPTTKKKKPKQDEDSKDATQKMETTELPDQVTTNPATPEQSKGVKKKKQVKTQDQELMIPPGDAYHAGATLHEKEPQIHHAPWNKEVHTVEENREHEKTLEARIEDDRRFIDNMQKFIDDMRDDLRLSTQ